MDQAEIEILSETRVNHVFKEFHQALDRSIMTHAFTTEGIVEIVNARNNIQKLISHMWLALDSARMCGSCTHWDEVGFRCCNPRGHADKLVTAQRRDACDLWETVK